jgi:hypothetical protein
MDKFASSSEDAMKRIKELVCVQKQDELTSKVAKTEMQGQDIPEDQDKDQSSCKKTPYLGHEDNDV